MIPTMLARGVLVVTTAAILSAPVLAQPIEREEPQAAAVNSTAGPLQFQLNNAETVEGSCQLSFVVQNDTGIDISQSSYNMTVVDTNGRVASLITFEFGAFPEGRPRVQQFALADLACEDLSAIAINEYGECATPDSASDTICEEAMRPSSLIDIEFPWSF